MNYLSVKSWVYECCGSFGSAVDKKTRNELFERQVLGVYWCIYQGHPTVHFGEYLFGRPNIA